MCPEVILHYKDTRPDRKLETSIPGKGIAQPRSHFLHSCVCKRFILYIPTNGLLVLLQENMYVDRSWEYSVYGKSLTDK
jgi:hypothetical protein